MSGEARVAADLYYGHQISAGSSRTYLLPSPRPSGTTPTTLTASPAPALVTSSWLRDALLLAQGDAHQQLSHAHLGLPLEELQYHPIRVLDASWQADFDTDAYSQRYKRGHIPGAGFLDLAALSAPRSGSHEDCPIPEASLFQRCVADLGVTSETHVVIYDSLDSRPAARAWFLFRLFGHDRVSVLDGGLKQWKRDNFEVCTGDGENNLRPEEVGTAMAAAVAAGAVACTTTPPGIPTPAGSAAFKATFRPELLRSFRDMKSIVENGEAQVIDSRPEVGGFFLSEDTESPSSGTFATTPSPEGSRRGSFSASIPGHMPGAVNLPFNNLFSPHGTLLPEADLSRVLEVAGVDLSVPVVASCQQGIASCLVVLVAFLLGVRDLPIYNGSWAEWERLAPPSLIVRTRKRTKG